ncbi:MAG TPA: NAD(P)/FAD-dependent oxidoreductase [Terriglobales bacterium]|nr:NAD(P)/FAD-dependent oxidoreductase [Terriglobales bacterium]
MSEVADVIVIGAGAAGLAAAYRLAREGRRVIVLEARSRVGGRILTLHTPDSDFPIELGAEFVHGRPAEITELARAARLELYESAGDDWFAGPEGLHRADFFAEVEEIFGEMEKHQSPDRSFLDFVRERFSGPRWGQAVEWALAFVSGFNAADPARISVQSLVEQSRADEKIDGHRTFRLRRGYSALMDFLHRQCEAAGVRFVFDCRVTGVEWQRGRARIVTNAPPAEREFEGMHAVITVPLGVLQARAIEFSPPLTRKQRSLDLLAMGDAVRVSIVFDEPFWASLRSPAGETLRSLRFLFSGQKLFRTWWSYAPLSAPLLTGWTAGPAADAFAGRPAEEVAAAAVASLGKIFGVDERAVQAHVRSTHTHDWAADPLSLGAYSYSCADGAKAPDELARPVDDTLHFAGEATDVNGHTATVHGALASGYRAAREVLAHRAG